MTHIGFVPLHFSAAGGFEPFGSASVGLDLRHCILLELITHNVTHVFSSETNDMSTNDFCRETGPSPDGSDTASRLGKLARQPGGDQLFLALGESRRNMVRPSERASCSTLAISASISATRSRIFLPWSLCAISRPRKNTVTLHRSPPSRNRVICLTLV